MVDIVGQSETTELHNKNNLLHNFFTHDVITRYVVVDVFQHIDAYKQMVSEENISRVPSLNPSTRDTIMIFKFWYLL